MDKIFNLNSGYGNFKIEHNKSVVNVSFNNKIDNELIDIINTTTINHNINDEYDNAEFKIIFDNNNTLVKGGAGEGKSYCIKKYDENSLFVTPFNTLSIENKKDGIESITFNNLVGQAVVETDKNKNKQYDVSSFKTVVFDEIFLHNAKNLSTIAKYINTHPTIKFLAAGDPDQLQPFGYSQNNVENVGEYLNNAINLIFPNNIALQINKRLNNEEDKIKLAALKKEIFDQTTPFNVKALCEKYEIKTITDMDDVKTTNNIAYFNYKCDIVNSYVHENLIDIPKNAVEIEYKIYDKKIKTKIIKKIKRVYFAGLKITCKKHGIIKSNGTEYEAIEGYKKLKLTKLFVNYGYKIHAINKNIVVILDEFEKTCIDISTSHLINFKLPYAQTLFACQGLSIDGPITIFDADCDYVGRNYFYTSITRTRELKNVTVFLTNDKENTSLKHSMINRYFNDKIASYKHQDKIAGRIIDHQNYIDLDWFMNRLKYGFQHCSCCNTAYYLHIDNGTIKSNITSDRIDCSLSHTVANCQFLCTECNRAKSNH